MMVLITGARMLTRTRLTRRCSRPASRAAERQVVRWKGGAAEYPKGGPDWGVNP